MFDKIKKFYDLGLWTESMVYDALEKALITPAEYTSITGKEIANE